MIKKSHNPHCCPELQPLPAIAALTAVAVQVFDTSLAVFIRAGSHVHTDISYFGTPSFRVHTFSCAPTVSVTLGPVAALDIVAVLQSGSFVEDKEVGRVGK